MWSNPKISTEQLGIHNLARIGIDTQKHQLNLIEYIEGDFFNSKRYREQEIKGTNFVHEWI